MMYQRLLKYLRRLHRDEEGQGAVEFVLLLIFVVFPIMLIVVQMFDPLGNYYRLISFSLSMPFP